MAYSEDDRGLGRNLSWNLNVHLKVRRVGAEVCDASEGAIDSGHCSADEERAGEAHVDGGLPEFGVVCIPQTSRLARYLSFLRAE